MKRKPRTGTIQLEVARIDFALCELGLSWTSEKPNCDVSRSTWQRISSGQPVSRRIAEDVANFLNYKVADLVVSENADTESDFRWPEHPEWKIVSADPGWQTTSNGLSFFRCKVEHRHVGLPTIPQFGRARVYDLSRVPDRDREKMTQRLTRHALVCREFSGCPWLVDNLSAAPVAQGQLWWVIDKWFEGRSLFELIGHRTFEVPEINRVMIQVAKGLSALHEGGYLIRELSPKQILLGDRSEVRLTELDLAKLLFADKTVSNGWSTNVYRAPEVADDTASVRSDLYSWAMVYLHAAAGDCLLNRTAVDSVEPLSDQSDIRSLLRKCLSPKVSQRPKSAAELVAALEAVDCGI